MEEMFIQTDEQRAILETVRRFVEEEISPRSAALDAETDPEACHCDDLIRAADAVGLRTMTLSEHYGGLDADSLTTAMVIEEMARGDVGASIAIGQTMKLARVMEHALNEEQKERVLPPFVADPVAMLTIGITEPENGSNYFLPHPTPFTTFAEKVAGGFKVNGMKHFITNGKLASYCLLMVQTERGRPMAEGSTCLLVERGRDGFSIGRVHDKMGMRLANNAELVFQDCFIPDENVVGEIGRGFDLLGRFFPSSNSFLAANAVGLAVTLYEKALEWAKIRIQGGCPLIEHDGIRAQLAEMKMLIDASRAYIHRAAWLADHQEEGWDATLGILPKTMAAQAAWKIATWTMEIYGGYGYMKETGIEKLVRDAANYLHSDGVNRTLFLKAANRMYA